MSQKRGNSVAETSLKQCSTCKKVKRDDQFSRTGKNSAYLLAKCRECYHQTRIMRKGITKPRGRNAIGPETRQILAENGLKYCPACTMIEPITNFYNERRKTDSARLSSKCKPCTQSDIKARRYGLTVAQVQELDRTTHCPGCQRSFSDPAVKMNYDHNHESGQFRRVLCHSCNLAIGHAQENPEWLRRLADLCEKAAETD